MHISEVGWFAAICFTNSCNCCDPLFYSQTDNLLFNRR